MRRAFAPSARPGWRREGAYRLPWLLLGWIWLSPAFALELQVLVTGLEGVEEQNVLTFLDIYQERDSERLEEHRLEHLHRVAPEQIREALQPFGYYKVEVDAQLRRPERGETAWRATYRVSPGPAARLAAVC